MQDFVMLATIGVCAAIIAIGMTWYSLSVYGEIFWRWHKMRPNERRTLFMIVMAIAAVIVGLAAFAWRNQ